MKPYQILLFLVSVLLCLFIIALFFPEEGLKIGNIHLKFTTLNDLTRKDTVKYAEISGILSSSSVYNNPEDLNDLETLTIPDSAEMNSSYEDSAEQTHDERRDINVYPIQVSPQNKTILHSVFRDLHSLRNTRKLVRLLHYGDSQIETDRMTSFLRHKMQVKFGGSGFGLIPPIALHDGTMSVKQEKSDDWIRYTGYMKDDSALNHHRYGALLSFSGQRATNEKKSWLKYTFSGRGYARSGKFNKVSLFLVNNKDTVTLKLETQSALFDAKTLMPDSSLKMLSWKFTETPEEILFSFEGRNRPDVYGISFDNSWGVAVDNIPLRGSSGLVFSINDAGFLGNMYNKLNVCMIILQFGGNIVPHLAEDYSFYEQFFKRELKVIKRIAPKVPVIVIGPGDMSYKDKDNYITYPSLTKVRDALRNAALDSGFAFWDMYEAMGGENSMPGWVNANPPLAVSDFVHFNVRGANVIGEMFYNAFMSEYDKWVVYSDSASNSRQSTSLKGE